jgi:hypothetical protein
MKKSFPSQIYFVLPSINCVEFVIYTRLLLSYLHKSKISRFINLKTASSIVAC